MFNFTSFKNFSYIYSSRIIVSGVQAAFYLIFATLLEPDGFGELSYIIAIAGTFSVVSRFGIPLSIIVYQAKDDVSTANQLNVLVIITTGISALILIPINIYASLLCVGFTFYMMNQRNLLGLKKYKNSFLISIVKSLLIITLPILLYFMFDIAGILVGMAITNIASGLNFLKIVNFKINSFHKLKTNYKVLIHNFGMESASSLVRWVDKLLIVPLFGFLSVGIYQFNLQILFALTLLPAALHVFLLSEESSGNKQKSITSLSILCAIILVIITIFLSPLIVSQFFPKYVSGITALQIIVSSLIPITLTTIMNAKLQSEESTQVGIPAIIKIGSFLILIILLGNIFGIEGLSLAFLLSAIIETISLWLIYRKKNFKKNARLE